MDDYLERLTIIQLQNWTLVEIEDYCNSLKAQIRLLQSRYDGARTALGLAIDKMSKER